GPSRHGVVELVERAVCGGDDGQKPGRAAVQGEAGEAGLVEDAPAAAAVEYLAGQLIAEVVHHGHAVAIAAGDVVQAVELPHVRQPVGGERYLAAPGVVDAYTVELGEAGHHALIQHAGRRFRRHLEWGGASAVEKARAVWSTSEVSEQ